MKTLSLICAGVLVLLVSAFAVACSDDDEPTEAEAKAAFCESLDELASAIQDMQAIDSSSTVGELREADEAVSSAMEDVRSSGEELADVTTQALEDAYDKLRASIEDIDDDTTIADAVSAVQTDVEALEAERAEAASAAQCSEDGTPTTAAATSAPTEAEGETPTAEAETTPSPEVETSPTTAATAEATTEPAPTETVAAEETPTAQATP